MENINCPTAKRMYFKAGAPVIVVYNISKVIRNSPKATFIDKDGEDALVKINGASIRIRRATWASYDQEGRIIGTRCQIPLRLFWASMINKMQGQELEAVCLHSAFDFTGGLIYTALSRVRRPEDIQVVDFHPSHVKGRNHKIERVNSLPEEPFTADCSCCKLIVADAHDVNEGGTEEIEDVVEFVSDSADELGEMFRDMPVEPQISEDVVGSLNGLLERVDDTECFFGDPSEDFDYKAFVLSYKDNSKLAEVDGFAKEKNEVIEQVVSCESKLKKITTYIHILWKNTAQNLRKYIPENIQEARISRAEFTKISQEVWRSNASAENHLMLKCV